MSSVPESNHGGQSPQHEKNGSAEGSVKRRRIALACLDCRRRKLKCDRIYPACSRCQKAGHPETCAYDPNAIDSLNERPSMDFTQGNQYPESHPSAPRRHPDPYYFANRQSIDADYGVIAEMRSHIHQLESRIIDLERAVNLTQQHAEPSNSNIQYDQPNPRTENKEFMTFRGKNYKTAFYGATHDTSCFNHLCSLKPFMKEMMVQHQALVQMQKKVRGSKVPRPPGGLSEYRLLDLYFSSFEKTYRVLHLPSFRSEYTSMWEDLANARPLFVSLVLLMLASMICVVKQEQPSFRGDSSSARETAIGWIEACDSFLETQSQKHITLNYLQARIVSSIAQAMNGVKKKRAWTTTGTLMSFAVSAGLHRDVECLNQKHGRDGPRRRVSYFDQEMRRRLWSTISELELQSAIERGMPASLPDLLVDCGPPCNCEDEDIDPGMDYQPGSRPVSIYTPSSFLHLMSTSWDMRRSLVSSINSASRPLDHQSVLRYDGMIRKALDGIPQWNGADAGYTSSLIQIQLQQLLIFVHRPVIGTGLPQGLNYLSTEYIGAAQTVIDLHYRLWKSGNCILLAFRKDLLGAGLSICHALESAHAIPDAPTSIRIAMMATNESLQCLENALIMLEDNVMRLGVGLHDYYAISSCIGLLKKRTSNGPKSEEFEAADRVAKLMEKLLSLEENYSAAATLASLPNMSITATNNGITPNSHGNAQTTGAESIGLEHDFNQINNFDLETLDWDFETFFTFA